MTPHVAVATPAAWSAASVAQPKIAESAGAVLTQWDASASPGGDAALVRGCVATPIPGWVDDMRPAIEARTSAFAGAAAEKMTGFPIDARSDGAGAFVLRPSSRLESEPIGVSRTFLGWGEGRVFTCFAACARRLGEGAAGCERSVATATLQGSSGPPRPGLALSSATWAIHHPSTAAACAAAFVLVAAFLAIATRRRPRSSLGLRSRSGGPRRLRSPIE